MKRSQPSKILWLIILSSSLMSMLAGCAPVKPEGEQQQGSAVLINKIEAREENDKTEIVVEGAGPILQYTSFQLSEPLRLVVDISDANAGEFQSSISVNKGPVLEITPSQMDNIVRLEITLARMVDTKVYQADGKLMIELGKPVEEAKAAPVPEPAVPVPTAPQPEPVKEEKAAPAEAPPTEAGTATVVTAVQATAGKDGVRVVITADGTMKPSTFMVEGKKLVVDVPGTKSMVRPSVIPVRKGGLDKVRVGQHPAPDQKVRVVLDLTKAMDYTATPEGNTVTIVMNPASPKGEEKAAQERAATQAGEKASAEEKEMTQLPEATLPAKARTRMETAPSFDTMTGVSRSKYAGRKISLDLQDADLVNVMRLFAEVANLNMILAPEVKGRVTVRMVNIPWDQAMDIILKMNGLGFALEDNILRIASVGALTREADEESRAKEAKKKAEDLITRIIPINYAQAGGIEGTIKKSLSPRGETVVDTRTNTLIVKDIAKHVDEVITLIKLLDKPIPQIMIEARIVEASLNFNRSIGVQWGGGFKADAAHGNPTGFAFPNSIGVTGGPSMGVSPSGNNFLVNMPAPAGAGTGGGAIGFTLGSISKSLNLDLILSALESTGEGKVISTPRVSALDNKEAKIEQGVAIPFSTSSAGGGTNVQFIDAKLSLTVTPHATPDNKIFMKITATKNAADVSLLGASGQPSIRKNEASTEILLADGETAVIGGILIIDRGQSITKVPFFGDLPLIGWLFRTKTSSEQKRELIIFITPRIIKQEVI